VGSHPWRAGAGWFVNRTGAGNAIGLTFGTTHVMPATSSRNLRAALTLAGLTFADLTCAGLTFADDNGLLWQSAGR